MLCSCAHLCIGGTGICTGIFIHHTVLKLLITTYTKIHDSRVLYNLQYDKS